MNFYKKPLRFISLVCAISLICSMLVFPVTASDTNRVTATTGGPVQQGSYAYCYVNIDSLEDMAALEVTVHFDPEKVKVIDVYNSVSCTLYDSAVNADNVHFSYIMDGKGKAEKTRLFYFRYQVLENAEPGEAWFDIIVGEAYDTKLNDIAVSGSRCIFEIKEAFPQKTCYVYGTGTVNTSVAEEFTLSWKLSSAQIASGTIVINYDPELFEVVCVENGSFLEGKMVDVNTDFSGAIQISFVSTAYSGYTDVVSVTFRTRQNKDASSAITFQATELMDKDLIPYSCNAYNTTVHVAYDSAYTGDAPSMRLEGSFSYEKMQITLVVTLEAGSRLGAGDFVITFDPSLVSYKTSTQGFSPSFFYIDERSTDAGELKFHIVSLSDIVTEETVLIVVFDVNRPYGVATADFTLDGSGLTDSLTERILLNFVDDSVWLEYCVTFCDENGEVIQTGIYHYGDTVPEPVPPEKESDVYGTYTFAGWDKPVTVCTGDTTYTATYALTYTDYIVEFRDWDGTPISTGIYHYGDVIALPEDPQRPAGEFCSVSFSHWEPEVHQECVGDAIYTAVYEMSTHEYEAVVTPPTCTEQGYTTHICHCGDSYVTDYVDATGHTYMDGHCVNCGAEDPDYYMPGDITGDGSVNNKDLTRLFRYLSGYDVDVVENALDVNGDGAVNNKDLTRLFRYLSGHDVEIR